MLCLIYNVQRGHGHIQQQGISRAEELERGQPSAPYQSSAFGKQSILKQLGKKRTRAAKSLHTVSVGMANDYSIQESCN